MGNLNTLQFKRVFNYMGSMDKALENIRTNLNPALMDGEPLICSYKEDNSIKYFLAIGCGNGKITVFPSFDNQSDFISFIRKYAGNDLFELISEDSDFTLELDSNNRYIFKIKKDILANFNWIEL
jgi:hypothetical protein